jgi:hypothetical protein
VSATHSSSSGSADGAPIAASAWRVPSLAAGRSTRQDPWRRANVDSPVGVAELAVGQLLTDCTESTIQPFASVPWSVRRAVLPGNE